MLYELFYRSPLIYIHVFKYVSFRGVLGAFFAFVITLLAGPWIVRKLRQHVSKGSLHAKDMEQLTDIHSKKQGTPIMGGLIIILAALSSVVLVCDLSNIYVLGGIYIILSFGLLGFVDDYIKLFSKRSKGLTKVQKLAWQFFMTSILAILMMYHSKYIQLYPPGNYDLQSFDTLTFPGFKKFFLVLGPWLYLVWTFMVVGGTSNGVNLTDGLDGLAIGCILIVVLTFSVMAYVSSRVDTSEYLNLLYVPGGSELVIFGLCLAGASLGFLWFNSFPAEVFMGDTGSLFLGAFVGYMALVVKQEFLLIVIGGVFVIETGSVILQVISFRVFGKRIFRVAPIHHHFEIKGLTESKITVRFWIVQIILALICLASLKLR